MENVNSLSHEHTRTAFKLLEKQFYIGDLYSPDQDQDWVLRYKSDDSAAFSNDTWYLTTREPISRTTYLYTFKNRDYSIKLDSRGSGWIGRHWLLSNQRKTRVYTHCSSLSYSMSAHRNSIISYLEGDDQGPESVVDFPESTENLTLVIKAYKHGNALSWELKNDTEALDNQAKSYEMVTLVNNF